ncbi:hypothetical protein ACEUZ9_002903 [Paracoccus litorisediminis]|uniref:hypothetical protein n=1 Tax=Paracoccus litorisediminis TaxID=2006130 RepID=UPI00373303B3
MNKSGWAFEEKTSMAGKIFSSAWTPIIAGGSILAVIATSVMALAVSDNLRSTRTHENETLLLAPPGPALDPVQVDAMISEHFQMLLAEPDFRKVIELDWQGAHPDNHMPMVSLTLELRDTLATISQDFAATGMARLPAEDQRSYYRVSSKIMRQWPVKACAMAISGDVSSQELQRAELAGLREIDPNEAQNYLSIVRRAALADLRANSPVRHLSDAQTAMAEKALSQEIVRLVSKNTTEETIRIAGPGNLVPSDAEVCEFGLTSMEAATALEGEIGRLVMAMLSSQE